MRTRWAAQPIGSANWGLRPRAPTVPGPGLGETWKRSVSLLRQRHAQFAEVPSSDLGWEPAGSTDLATQPLPGPYRKLVGEKPNHESVTKADSELGPAQSVAGRPGLAATPMAQCLSALSGDAKMSNDSRGAHCAHQTRSSWLGRKESNL